MISPGDASGAHDRPTQVGALNRPPFLCRYAADRIASSPAHRAPTHSPYPLALPEGVAPRRRQAFQPYAHSPLMMGPLGLWAGKPAPCLKGDRTAAALRAASTVFVGYRTERMMILPPSGAACPRRTPGAARRMFRFGQAPRPRRYRLRNVGACPVAFSLRHPAYPYCGFV